MKKTAYRMILCVMCLLAMLAMTACAASQPTVPAATTTAPTAEATAESTAVPAEMTAQAPATAPEQTESGHAKTLVVYFSVPDDRDNSYVEINGERLGNTQYMAYVIQENTGADLFRIQPKTPYPTDHDELLRVAQEEIRTNARPEIDGIIERFGDYDTVFVGYPNWNADMPYILYTFFETYDFSGKTIVPFNTHGGSGFSGTQETIAQLEPNATMLEGKSISRNRIEDAAQEIVDWLDSIGMLKPAE